MNGTDWKTELGQLIRARFPIVWLASTEEGRVRRAVGEIATAQQKELVIWTATKGFTSPDGKVTSEGATDLGAAFQEIEAAAKGGSKRLYLMQDLHRFVAEPDRMVYRLLRDAAFSLRGSAVTLLPIGEPRFPRELEKDVAVLRVPYPTQEELGATLDEVLRGALQTRDDIAEPKDGERETILRAAQGLTETAWENIVALSLVSERRVNPQVVVRLKEQEIQKSGVADFRQAVEGLDDVGGCANAKAWIERRARTFSPEAKAYGILPPKGIFLAGVTGCGKSLLAKAAANYLRVPLLMAESSKILGKYVGESERNLDALLRLAEAVAPCILFFDEAEKALAPDARGDANVGRSIFGQLLTWLQESKAPVLTVMTANDPLKLPPELFTRFDATFFVDLPDAEAREAIFAVQLKKVGRDPRGFDLPALARVSDRWSGREIEKAVAEALVRAFESGLEDMRTSDLAQVLKERRPIADQRRGEIEKMREWGNSNALAADKTAARTGAGRKLEL